MEEEKDIAGPFQVDALMSTKQQDNSTQVATMIAKLNCIVEGKVQEIESKINKKENKIEQKERKIEQKEEMIDQKIEQKEEEIEDAKDFLAVLNSVPETNGHEFLVERLQASPILLRVINPMAPSHEHWAKLESHIMLLSAKLCSLKVEREKEWKYRELVNGEIGALKNDIKDLKNELDKEWNRVQNFVVALQKETD